MDNVVAAVCICACTQNQWYSDAQQSRCDQHLQRWARPDEHRREATLLYVLEVRLHPGDELLDPHVRATCEGDMSAGGWTVSTYEDSLETQWKLVKLLHMAMTAPEGNPKP